MGYLKIRKLNRNQNFLPIMDFIHFTKFKQKKQVFSSKIFIAFYGTFGYYDAVFQIVFVQYVLIVPDVWNV